MKLKISSLGITVNSSNGRYKNFIKYFYGARGSHNYNKDYEEVFIYILYRVVFEYVDGSKTNRWKNNG